MSRHAPDTNYNKLKNTIKYSSFINMYMKFRQTLKKNRLKNFFWDFKLLKLKSKFTRSVTTVCFRAGVPNQGCEAAFQGVRDGF